MVLNEATTFFLNEAINTCSMLFIPIGLVLFGGSFLLFLIKVHEHKESFSNLSDKKSSK